MQQVGRLQHQRLLILDVPLIADNLPKTSAYDEIHATPRVMQVA